MTGNACLFDKVSHFAGQSGEREAVVCGSVRITYAELAERASRIRTGLEGLELAPHSRIAILCGNRPEFFEIWFGTSIAGHVFTPINARLAGPEVAYILNDSQATVLFVDQAFHALVEGIAHDLPDVKQIFTLDDHASWHSLSDWRDSHSSSDPQHPANAGDTVVQMYTSGTTGFPKGVELSHGNFIACARSVMGLEEWQPGEIILATAPLFHTAGSVWSHCALQSGGTVVLLRELSPESVLSAFEEEGVNQTLLVPALLRMILDSPRCATTDYSELRRIVYGASPIPVPVLQRAIKVFACDFEQGYGLTESVGPITMLRPEDHDGGEKMKSCGKAVPGTTIRVADSAGIDCATGEVGEILVAGLQVMKGYWNRPDETRKAIRNGWLHTGDAGYFDGDGYLYIHDRMKDMVISGGENVYPAEVESVLAGCDGVADVAVIGVPDDHWGEAVKAIVVASPDARIEASDVINYARQRIAAFKCPKSVDFVDSIPRNPSGKILKQVLREPYWQGHERRVS
jgi:acyl-CoA synthetase (AMP-forming)/AMP-acid ligase II